MGDLFRSDLPRLVREADIVIEVRDARIPLASALPLDHLIGPGKRRFVVLSRADLADEGLTRLWREYMRGRGLEAFAVNCRTGDGLEALKKALVDAGRHPGRRRGVGTGLRTLRAVVVGIPNVGKSSLVNRLAGARKARVGARPGITRGRQWIMVGGRTALLDTPGVIKPGAASGQPGATGRPARLYLSAVGAIPDDAVDTVMVAGELIRILGDVAPQGLAARYGPGLQDLPETSVLLEIGQRRGCLGPGGQVDLNRAAQVVLADFREGKLGRVTLESPVDLWPAVREGPAHDKPVRDEPDRGGDTPTGP